MSLPSFKLCFGLANTDSFYLCALFYKKYTQINKILSNHVNESLNGQIITIYKFLLINNFYLVIYFIKLVNKQRIQKNFEKFNN